MPLEKADVKLLKIDRIIQYGKKDVLQLVDRTTKEVLADVRNWSMEHVSPATADQEPTYYFRLGQTADTVDYLPTCGLALNGVLHTVVDRDNPDSVGGLIWIFHTRPDNERIDN